MEVGPGFGALTSRMLALGANVTAIEFDHRICEWLRSVLVPKGLRLVEGDACKVRFAELFPPGTPFRLISNLPYSAGTVVVAKLLDLEVPPEEMIVMLQKEVALRLAADAGDEEYGALSVRARTVYDADGVPDKTLPGGPPGVLSETEKNDQAAGLRLRTRTCGGRLSRNRSFRGHPGGTRHRGTIPEINSFFPNCKLFRRINISEKRELKKEIFGIYYQKFL